MSAYGNARDAVCARLRACEESLLDPAVRRDRAQVAAYLAEDFHEVGSSGRVWSREQILDLLATEVYQAATMEDFECRLVAEDVMLVTYRSVRTDPRSGERTASLRSSIWTVKSGAWRLRFHQGTKLP
jgi:hypothetical protein